MAETRLRDETHPYSADVSKTATTTPALQSCGTYYTPLQPAAKEGGTWGPEEHKNCLEKRIQKFARYNNGQAISFYAL